MKSLVIVMIISVLGLGYVFPALVMNWIKNSTEEVSNVSSRNGEVAVQSTSAD
jgi:ABC-type phosphate transport system auxiliary subunit